MCESQRTETNLLYFCGTRVIVCWGRKNVDHKEHQKWSSNVEKFQDKNFLVNLYCVNVNTSGLYRQQTTSCKRAYSAIIN